MYCVVGGSVLLASFFGLAPGGGVFLLTAVAYHGSDVDGRSGTIAMIES